MTVRLLRYGRSIRTSKSLDRTRYFPKIQDVNIRKTSEKHGKIVFSKSHKVFGKSLLNFGQLSKKFRDLPGNFKNVFWHVREKSFLKKFLENFHHSWSGQYNKLFINRVSSCHTRIYKPLVFSYSPRKLGQYERPRACKSWYRPRTRLIKSYNYCFGLYRHHIPTACCYAVTISKMRSQTDLS